MKGFILFSLLLISGHAFSQSSVLKFNGYYKGNETVTFDIWPRFLTIIYSGLNKSVANDSSFNIKIDSSMAFFRFYEDGTVINSTIKLSAPVDHLRKWFNKESFSDNTNRSKGKYSIKSDSIFFFTTASSWGTVVYKGLINGNVIFLKSKSLINGYEGEEIVNFMPVDSLK